MNLEIDLLQDHNLQDGIYQTETIRIHDAMIAQTAMALQMVMVLPDLQMTNQRRLLLALAVTGLPIESVTEVTG
jgi:predicted transposase YdaD